MGAHDSIGPMLQLIASIESKREFTRIPLHAAAWIRSDGDIIKGEVADLSLSGVFVSTAGRLAIDQSVEVTIFDAATLRTIHDLKAKVVRVTGKGIGLHFA